MGFFKKFLTIFFLPFVVVGILLSIGVFVEAFIQMHSPFPAFNIFVLLFNPMEHQWIRFIDIIWLILSAILGYYFNELEG